MRDERQGVSKEQILKEARENQDLVDFVKTITKEEMQRLKATREYETIPVGTPTYKIAVLCDSLRQNLRKIKMTISQRLWNIDDLTNNLARLNLQLNTHSITETLKNGIVMNEAELKSLIKHHEWVRDGEFNSLYPSLGEMRGVVGHKDISRKIIMDIETFDKFVLDLETYLKNYGYGLFGDIK